MSLDSVFFLTKTAFLNMVRNKLLTLASLAVLMVSLITFGCSMLVVANVNVFLDSIGEINQVTVFIDKTASEDTLKRVGEELAAIQNVTKLTFVSADEALERYKEMLGEDSYLLDNLGSENPFNPSYEFEIADISKYDQTMYSVEKIEGLSNVRARKDTVDRLVVIRRVLLSFAVWIVVLFGFLSVFVIMNAVKLSMFARRLEISIMKYVGASDGFIRVPFIIEGATIGAIAGVLSHAIQHYVYVNVIQSLFVDLSLFAPLDFSEVSVALFFTFVGSGILFGVLGSVLPMRKYLDV